MGQLPLWNSGKDVGADDSQVVLGGFHGVYRFHIADDGDVVEGKVSLAAHAVETDRR